MTVEGESEVLFDVLDEPSCPSACDGVGKSGLCCVSFKFEGLMEEFEEGGEGLAGTTILDLLEGVRPSFGVGAVPEELISSGSTGLDGFVLSSVVGVGVKLYSPGFQQKLMLWPIPVVCGKILNLLTS